MRFAPRQQTGTRVDEKFRVLNALAQGSIRVIACFRQSMIEAWSLYSPGSLSSKV